MFGLFKRRKKYAVEVEVPSYSEVIGMYADSSGKDEKEIHYHIYKWCVGYGLILRNPEDPFQTTVNLMRRAYQRHRDAVTAELERFCSTPEPEPEKPEPPPETAEWYPLPPGHVALKDPRFSLLSVDPESLTVYARQPNRNGGYWWAENAIMFGEMSGVSLGTLEQCRIAIVVWPPDDIGISKANPQDLGLPAPPVDPEPTLEPEPAKPLTEPPLPVGYEAIEGYPGLCLHGWGTVVFRENKMHEATFWHSGRYAELTQEEVSDAAIADALRFMVEKACERAPSLNIKVVSN